MRGRTAIHTGGGGGHRLIATRRQMTMADDKEIMAKRIERMLTTDPGMGIVRHVDAGAKEFAGKAGVGIPLNTLQGRYEYSVGPLRIIAPAASTAL